MEDEKINLNKMNEKVDEELFSVAEEEKLVQALEEYFRSISMSRRHILPRWIVW